jgi:hypothetical protein
MKISVDSFKEYLPPNHPNIIIKEGSCLIKECFYQIKERCSVTSVCSLIKNKEHYVYKPPITILLEEL